MLSYGPCVLLRSGYFDNYQFRSWTFVEIQIVCDTEVRSKGFATYKFETCVTDLSI